MYSKIKNGFYDNTIEIPREINFYKCDCGKGIDHEKNHCVYCGRPHENDSVYYKRYENAVRKYRQENIRLYHLFNKDVMEYLGIEGDYEEHRHIFDKIHYRVTEKYGYDNDYNKKRFEVIAQIAEHFDKQVVLQSIIRN